MTALVSVETVLVVLLVVLVAGLLRSHAEILRRLAAAEDAAARGRHARVPPGLATPDQVERADSDLVAPAVSGQTPSGDAVVLDFSGCSAVPTLLAFLTSGCTTCAGFWAQLGERRLGDAVRTVIVAHGDERERPARLSKLAPSGVPVVMSSQAWLDYRVPGSPYFVLVDSSIQGEGVATSWEALASLVTDALEESSGSAGERRARDVDQTLAAAGIGPSHPSLYPTRAQPRR
jgi:hypothetical protein